MGGYGPPTTGFSKSMKRIGDSLEKQFGDRIDVKYCWNIMDFGYKAEEILWLVESGMLTLGYQSSSYLTDRVPELSFVDLPFLFADNDKARGAMDGALGRRLVQAIESKCNFRILGWYENGFRHISNRVRTVRTPADLKGMHIRVLPSQIQKRTFELLGARPHDHGPHRRDPHDQGRRDRRPGKPAHQHRHLRRAQVPPLPHPQQSFLHLAADLPAPADLRCLARRPEGGDAEGGRRNPSRSSASFTSRKKRTPKRAIKAEGCEIVELDAAQHDAFAAAVQPIYAEARKLLGDELFDLAKSS